MFPYPLPKLQLYLVCALAVVLLLAITFGAGATWGWVEATSKAKELAAKREQQLLTDLAASNAKYRTAENDHEKRVAELRVRLADEAARERAGDARAIADLRSGAVRMRLPARCVPSSGTGEALASAPGADEPARAELAPETAAALQGIANDGDEAIRTLSGLQDWADEAVKLCGKPK